MVAAAITAAVAAVLAAAIALYLAIVVSRQRHRIQSLREKRRAIVTEEHRMFKFLHHLGEVLQKERSEKVLAEHIVEGVRDVVGAKGGMLYTLDRRQKNLIPQFLSAHSPSLIPVPEGISKQEEERPGVLASYLRMTAVSASEGVFGRCLKDKRPIHLAPVARQAGGPRAAEENKATSAGENDVEAMVASLEFGGKTLGVIAVTGPEEKPRFTVNDFAVFKSVAEQSALTLGNSMVHREAGAKRRLDRELRMASDVQRVLLPREFPDLQDYRVAALNRAARTLSGDYYDFIKVDEGRFGVVIADVSGKGLPASLIMAMARSVLRAYARISPSPAAVLSAVNRVIFPDMREDMFISMVYLILEKDTSELVFARAGHDPPLHFRAESGQVEELQAPGLAVGVDEGTVFERVTRDARLLMGRGDVLLLYTDGVTEAANSRSEEFGMERMRAVFGEAAAEGAEKVLARVAAEVEGFTEGQPQSDDITLVAIEKR
ncbi:MAG TPA: GAF domain-containing SpoIIE family protein phosphatase [Verrucomicrobiales bacterium]|nr:GAF domain-containing SpoIIE family protein phosphatase [Verrucomicrobiales bacterium]